MIDREREMRSPVATVLGTPLLAAYLLDFKNHLSTLTPVARALVHVPLGDGPPAEDETPAAAHILRTCDADVCMMPAAERTFALVCMFVACGAQWSSVLRYTGPRAGTA